MPLSVEAKIPVLPVGSSLSPLTIELEQAGKAGVTQERNFPYKINARHKGSQM